MRCRSERSWHLCGLHGCRYEAHRARRRRKLLLASLAGVFLSLAALTAAFRLSEARSPALVPPPPAAALYACAQPGTSCVTCLQHGCTFCEAHSVAPGAGNSAASGFCVARGDEQICASAAQPHAVAYTDGCPSPYSTALLLIIMAYLLAFAAGMGPVPWAVNAEIYALQFRGAANGIAGTANWLTNGVVSQTFLLLVHASVRLAHLECTRA